MSKDMGSIPSYIKIKQWLLAPFVFYKHQWMKSFQSLLSSYNFFLISCQLFLHSWYLQVPHYIISFWVIPCLFPSYFD
jgi:hypothetical protein